MVTTRTRNVLIALMLCLGAAGAAAREREPNQRYADRRAKLAAQVDGPVIVFGYTGQEDASPAYVFAQEDYFYYLTGHNEEGAAVLVVPNPPAGQTYDGPREVLYLPARNLQTERWNGVRMGPDTRDIARRTGFVTVKDFATLKNDLAALAKIYPAFHTLLPPRRSAGYPHRQNWLEWLKQAAPGAEFKDVTSTIATLRQIKAPSELRLLTKSIEASMDAHLEAMRMMRPGLWEYEVAAKMEYVHKSAGCEGEGYAPIVGAAFNSTVLHYSMPVNQIKDGDVIVLDVGAKCDGYVADITRTLPANGKFTPRQREIYEIVLGAQNAVFAAMKPGMTMGGQGENSLGRIATEYINSHGKDLKGEPLGKYFIHGLGHHIGLYVHDPGPPRPLEPGMVLTVEPGIYIPDENLGVRIEDIVLITETGYKLLTARLPRAVEDVEKEMAAAMSLNLPEVESASIPFYPSEAEKARIEGTVQVRISTDGHRVTATQIVTGHPMLAGAAETNARTWQFKQHEPVEFTALFGYRILDRARCTKSAGFVRVHLPTLIEVAGEMACDPPQPRPPQARPAQQRPARQRPPQQRP